MSAGVSSSPPSEDPDGRKRQAPDSPAADALPKPAAEDSLWENMDTLADALLGAPEEPAAPGDVPPASTARPSRRSGRLVGIVCGVLAGLLAIPPVRYTLLSQLQFAFAEEIPMARVLDARKSSREAHRLDAVAATAPDDYLLQVGRATAFAAVDGARETLPTPTPAYTPVDNDYSDHTLYRLGLLARSFPDNPGACAHLARYMMLERVRIQRAELASPASAGPPLSLPPPTPLLPTPNAAERHKAPAALPPPMRTITVGRSNVRWMEWALRSGEAHDPDNAFWPAMLATTYFAAERDQEGLRELARVSHKNHWDAFIYEEVLGQWRLYSAAYGDNGATQKIGPLSLVAFPHLREIRRMAEMVRWHADRAAAAGRISEAVRLRRNLAWLGLTMRDTAQWALEALFGTELFVIASTDSDARPSPDFNLTLGSWEQKAAHYLNLLQQTHRVYDIAWLRQQVQACIDLRQRIDLARADASYPGIPPGIPLEPLFGNWMAGACLLQQLLALITTAALAWLWRQSMLKNRPSIIENQPSVYARRRLVANVIVLLLTLVTGFWGALLLFGDPSPRSALLFLVSLTVLLMLGAERLHRLRIRRSADASQIGPRSASPDADAEGVAPTSLPYAALERAVERRWSAGTTLRLLLLLLLPALAALYLLRPFLSSMHPVAILLTSLVGTAHIPAPEEALKTALLASALPLGLVLIASLWALYRRVSPLAGALIALRRMLLPTVVCLVVGYLLLLNRTLRLDAAASRAINEAAQNDLQWVLTHSGEGT